MMHINIVGFLMSWLMTHNQPEQLTHVEAWWSFSKNEQNKFQLLQNHTHQIYNITSPSTWYIESWADPEGGGTGGPDLLPPEKI